MSNFYVKDERVNKSLLEIAKNIVALADSVLPKYRNLKCVSFFATSHWGDKSAEIIVHGIEQKDLRTLIAGCNSYVYHQPTMFGRGMGYKVPLDDIMPHVILCNEDKYESKICNRMAIFKSAT